ncbi:MAG: hypothetical protein J6B07_04540, partial [Opitutales bacterium]|nr:hypothetical protein [Opitutales bacterium]
MLDEDVVIKTTRNVNETILVWNVVLAVLIPFIFFGGSSDILTGLFVSLGVVAPINTLNYIYTWQPRPYFQMTKILAYCIPFIMLLVISICGVLNGGINSMTLGGYVYHYIDSLNDSFIINVSPSVLEPILENLVTFFAFLCGLSIYLITDSRFVIRKFLVWASSLGALITVLGCLFMFTWNFEGSIFADSTDDFFSIFPCSAHWASWGILWLGASLAVSIFSVQRFRSFSFFYSLRFLCLVTSIVLYVCILISGKILHQFFGSLIFAVAVSMICFDMIPLRMNARKHEMLRHISSHTKRLKKLQFPFVCYGLLAILSWSITISTAIDICNDTRLLIADEPNPNSITYVEKISVIEDSQRMLTDKRLMLVFGSASFPWIFSFYQGSDLGASPWNSP